MVFRALLVALLAIEVTHALVVSPTPVSANRPDGPSPSADLKGKTLIILRTNQTHPYTSFFNDLLNILQTELGFNSTIDFLDAYGRNDNHGRWDGMVGRLANRTADFALSDLTITPEREKVMDFTAPFIVTGMTIIANKTDVEGMNSVVDLVNQGRVKVTCRRDGSFIKFLNETDIPVYKTVYQAMVAANATDPNFLVSSNAEGVQRVMDGAVAMFMEQLIVRHVTNNYCTLTQLGGLLNSLGFGIGLQKDSPYTDLFSQTVIKLTNEGAIRHLLDKYVVSNC